MNRTITFSEKTNGTIGTKIYSKIVFALFLLFGFTSVFGQTQNTVTTAGTSSFTVPAGVTSVTVQTWGSGGAGGGSNTNNSAASGGGGGAYSFSNTITVTPGTTYTNGVVVGAGGTGSIGAAGGDGNASSVTFGSSLTVNGGNGGAGTGTNISPVGDGGAPGTFAGGNGGSATQGVNGSGGGGGSSAGTAAAGNNGTASAAGAAVTGGGAGGTQGATAVSGSAGSAPGGGGGGGGDKSGAVNTTGGDGAAGKVIISYFMLTGTSNVTVCNGTTATITVSGTATDLPVGSYTVVYDLSLPNASTNNSTTMTVSTAGTGTFATVTLSNAGATTITITSISSTIGGVDYGTTYDSTGNANNRSTITVSSDNTADAASSTPTLCINTALTAITHTTTGATGIGAATGIPSGVIAAWASNIITITGTPTVAGIFNYSIPLTGGCGIVDATGTITVIANNTAGVASSSPTLCVNTGLTDITHSTTGATSIANDGVLGANGLPAGVSATWFADTITISGTPSASGIFNYSIPLTGGCGSVDATGTITVNGASTAAVISGSASICLGSSTNIQIAITGGLSPYTVVYTTGSVSSYTSGSNISVLPTSTTTYTIISVTDANGCLGTGDSGSAVVTIDLTTSIDGGVSWDNGVPSSGKSIVFDGSTGTISADLSACSLRLINSAVVTVSSGFDVTLSGAITIDSGSTFTMNNNTNLIQSTTIANSGTIIVNRNSPALKRLDYTLWSSPVAGQGLYAFTPFTLPNRFYVYDTSTNLYNNSVGFNLTGLQYPAPLVAPNGVNGTDTNNVPFVTGKGYLIRMPWNHPTTATVWNGSFTGVPNNGNLSFAMSTGYNAVGNPYPSRINVHNFIDGNINITGSLYFWRKTNDNAATSYATLTKTAYVANGAAGGDTGTGYFNTGDETNWVINIGQGFIVNATSSSNLSFTNSMRRSLNADQFFRTPQSVTTINNGLYWLNLTTDTGIYSQMAVGYSSDGTLGDDRGIDGKNINQPFYLTSLIGVDEYSIQGRPDFQTDDIVPLSYKITVAGNYTISIDHAAGAFVGGLQPIYLKDNLTSALHNLNTGAYSFTSAIGTFANRFEIIYALPLGVGNPIFTANSVIIYNHNNEFVVNTGNIIMYSVKVFDIRGRLLQERKDINASQTTVGSGLSNEVLLVQITSEDGITVTKKVIR